MLSPIGNFSYMIIPEGLATVIITIMCVFCKLCRGIYNGESLDTIFLLGLQKARESTTNDFPENCFALKKMKSIYMIRNSKASNILK